MIIIMITITLILTIMIMIISSMNRKIEYRSVGSAQVRACDDRA